MVLFTMRLSSLKSTEFETVTRLYLREIYLLIFEPWLERWGTDEMLLGDGGTMDTNFVLYIQQEGKLRPSTLPR